MTLLVELVKQYYCPQVKIAEHIVLVIVVKDRCEEMGELFIPFELFSTMVGH
jgi:hypothetical protein